MLSRSDQPTVAYADFFRSRLRSLLPLGLISFVGVVIYFLFSSVNLKSVDPAAQRTQNPKHPHFWVDGLGRHGLTRIPQDNRPTVSAGGPQLEEKIDQDIKKLNHILKEPFEPKANFKPVPDSREPWLPTTPAGVKLLNRLSKDRFPPPGVKDTHRGSSAPSQPPWPKKSLLSEKRAELKKPIPEELIHGLNTSYVWKEASQIKEGKLPKVQWPGFDKLDWESESDKMIRLERQGWVRRGFQHVWEGYKSKAWGHDELKPISGLFQDPFGGWGATLVDSLDTLLIMNLTHEYNYARTHVRAIDWAHTVEMGDSRQTTATTEAKISFFETVIRYLGGLISAYDLSGDKLMLESAKELAQWLLPAFGTPSGLPAGRYQMGLNPFRDQKGTFCLADIGSLTLEFTRLSQLTSKGIYYDVVHKIINLLDKIDWSSSSRLGTLFPTHVDFRHPEYSSGKYTFGAMADSYYEYLIKEYQLLRGTNSQYGQMFASAMDSAHKHLVKTYEIEKSGGKNITVIGDVVSGTFVPSLDHLTCFSGAMTGLGAKLLDRNQDLDLALKHTDACAWMYESTKTGLGPECASIVTVDDHTQWQQVLHEGKAHMEMKTIPVRGVKVRDSSYLGRPETIESVYYMWRITGDRQWQDRGWTMFTSWMESCITQYGFADLNDVNVLPPDLSDKQESFVLGETFKYYYLLFSEPDLISLDDFVMNTEAHPFRIETQENRVTTLWTGPDEEIDKLYVPPWVKGDERGFGTYLQQWSRVNPDELSDSDRRIYNKVLGVNT